MFLEHVNLTVSDLERSIAFYRDLFGFELRWRGQLSDGAPAAHVGDERTYVALFEAAIPGSAGTDYGQVGLNHFGYVVDELADFRARLGRLGVTPHMEADYTPGARLYLFDPDGIEIELVEYNVAGG